MFADPGNVSMSELCPLGVGASEKKGGRRREEIGVRREEEGRQKSE